MSSKIITEIVDVEGNNAIKNRCRICDYICAIFMTLMCCFIISGIVTIAWLMVTVKKHSFQPSFQPSFKPF